MGVAGPAALRFVFQIRSEMFLHAIFVAGSVEEEGEIQVGVGERGSEFDGAFEVFDGGAAIAQFFKNAAEIEIGERVLRLEFDGGFKAAAGFCSITEMEKRGAEIYVRFDPVGSEFDGVTIGVGGARHGGGAGVIREADFKPLFGGVRWERENLVLKHLGVEFEQQLLRERLDRRSAGPGLRDDNLFAVGADV